MKGFAKWRARDSELGISENFPIGFGEMIGT